ncbi:4370_t:CDS:2 [Entrophospora sp. SA101]|nr:4370_t:CDS:2 [Entrophospora sp. SA101]
MENCPKTPSSYLNDWKLFLSWLTSTNLNVQICCLVRLGEIFYEPLMQFMIGRDPHPRIYTESGFKNLPNGRRAHEMPDKVTEWLSFLRDLKENFDIVFGQELLEALELLDSDEWENNLNEIRAQQKRQKLNVLQENIQQHYGQNYANSLYSNLFQN